MLYFTLNTYTKDANKAGHLSKTDAHDTSTALPEN